MSSEQLLSANLHRTPRLAWRRWLSTGGADVAAQLMVVLLGLGAWELIAWKYNTDFWTSRPSAIAVQMAEWWRSGQLASDLRLTLTAAAGGFLIGSIAGALIGFVLGWVKRLGTFFEPFILSIYTLPKIALAPLFVFWFGIGLTNKIMFSAMLVFFMVFFTTFQGTRQVDRDLVENARVLGANRWHIWTKIAIPYSAVWVFTGIRIGLPYALIGAIVGEFVAAEAGVGFRIREATSFFDTAGVFAGLLVLMAISISLLGLLKLVETRALSWQNAKGTISVDKLA